MSYRVRTTGRVQLPEHLESQALTVLEVELDAQAGAFSQDASVDSLDGLARYVGATVRREGDWLTLTTDETGDPQWSDQATAFYAGLGRWVQQGEVHLEGQDGGRWSYRYGPDGVIQIGQNGWDGSLVPFGDPVSAASASPVGAARQVSTSAEARPPRTFAMAMLLIVGVVLIIGIAMLGAGIG